MICSGDVQPHIVYLPNGLWSQEYTLIAFITRITEVAKYPV